MKPYAAFAALALAGFMPTPAMAQTVSAPSAKPGAVFQLQAHNQTGAPFAVEQIKGRVALVFFWSTGCAVCRDSLPELRKNLTGWKDKPFALVTVNLDAKEDEWLAYERIAGQTQVVPKGLLTLRQDAASPMPGKLPVTLLVDSKGKVVQRIEGRLAPEAWDGVADLLP